MVTENLISLLQNFSFPILWDALKPLLFFIVGIVVYSIFIFKFYRFVARKDIFEIDVDKYTPDWKGVAAKLAHIVGYILKHLFIYPLFLFFWFIVLTVLLVFLTKSQTIHNIMLISVALIGAIRVTAYYSEDLSKDLAKMMPFALLGVFLVDITHFSLAEAWTLLSSLPYAWLTALYYLCTIIGLEFILRIAKAIFGGSTKKK